VTSESERALVDEILKDAETKARRTRERAERRAKGIAEKAGRDAAELEARLLAAAEERAERAARTILATLPHEIQRCRIDAQESVIQAAFDAARELLLRKEDSDYPAALVALAADAIRMMEGDAFILTFAAVDEPSVNDELLRRIEAAAGRPVRLGRSEEAGHFSGGVIVTAKDGRQRYDNSFEARERRLRAKLRRTMAEALFETETAIEPGHEESKEA